MSRWGFVLLIGAVIILAPGKTEWFHTMGRDDTGYEEPGKSAGHNRLAMEKSPYLLQHADNPVNWYPWKEEAFAKARDEDKPIFLSIGYSACHWCQVMEEESFRDEEVAELLNKHFVSIKVDREERPDIDNVYMTVCQAMTGSGGWPLSIIMTPDRKPFFAGTYFPKNPRRGLPGLLNILGQVADLWQRDRTALVTTGDRVAEAVGNAAGIGHAGELDAEILQKAYQNFRVRFDEAHGGFGKAPKFPSPHNLSFLLRWWLRTGDQLSLRMVEQTLDAMRWGGIYDHLGFGFHRYSTDERWHIPHFEKMLYDQALLTIAYVEAYQATGDERYRKVADEIITYVMRDLTSPDGAFYSSENADSEGEEGKFYTWTHGEIIRILGEKRGGRFCRFYGVDEAGNLTDGKSVLRRSRSLPDAARDMGIAPDELGEELEGSREELLSHRKLRARPSLDDKILTDWNGLMIASLAKASQAFGDERYAETAEMAARFIMRNLREGDGGLLHRYRDGEAAIPAFLDDYAFFTWGLIELYEATFKTEYLREALTLTDRMIELFWDESDGGFYFTATDGEKLLLRAKEAYDGAIPSGNSVAALNLLRLGRMAMRDDLEKKADQLFQSFGEMVSKNPSYFSQLLTALDFNIGPTSEIIVAGDLCEEGTRGMLDVIRTRFLPRKVLLLHPPDGGEEIEAIATFVKNQGRVDGETAVYVCENFACKLPARSEEELISLLGSLN